MATALDRYLLRALLLQDALARSPPQVGVFAGEVEVHLGGAGQLQRASGPVTHEGGSQANGVRGLSGKASGDLEPMAADVHLEIVDRGLESQEVSCLDGPYVARRRIELHDDSATGCAADRFFGSIDGSCRGYRKCLPNTSELSGPKWLCGAKREGVSRLSGTVIERQCDLDFSGGPERDWLSKNEGITGWIVRRRPVECLHLKVVFVE
jgi:hypothetical protein